MTVRRARIECERKTELFGVVYGRFRGGQVAYLDTFLKDLFGEEAKVGDVFQVTVEKNPRKRKKGKGKRPC